MKVSVPTLNRFINNNFKQDMLHVIQLLFPIQLLCGHMHVSFHNFTVAILNLNYLSGIESFALGGG